MRVALCCSFCTHEIISVVSLPTVVQWVLMTPASSTTALSCTLAGFPESLMSLVEAVLVCLEARLYLMVKGAKEYFFMSALIGLVKTKLSPAQANAHKQEVVDRILSFAQTLFHTHAICNHLGDRGMGSFARQVRELSIHLSTI